MRKILIGGLAAGLGACTSAVEDDRPIGAWQLVWQDEFGGEAGAPLDETKWAYDVGGDGWGNNQLEYNTDRTDNVRLDGNGAMIIEARREYYKGNDYTSARIKTQDRFSMQYGRVEARIQLPKGSGLWPAFWMLGTNFPEVGWPGCGEIDIMEYRGEQPYTVIGTVHGPGYSGGDGVGDTYTLPEGDFSEDWHVFAVDIDPGHIAWSVDDVVFHTLSPGNLPDGTPWVFDNEWFLILNVAVGGNFVGPVDDSALPAQMRVGHVRVFERAP